MACNNICKRYKTKYHPRDGSVYNQGAKRCTMCEIYIDWDGKYCPCCRFQLRTKSKIPALRKKLKDKTDDENCYLLANPQFKKRLTK